MSYSTYFLNVGDKVPCMRCGDEMQLEYEPPKCCMSKQDSYYNECGCQGAPEPIFCEKCWKELEEE